MFRPIRRKKNEISLPAAQQLLREARRGVLAVNGDGGYPYAIPINYLYDEAAQKLYFHGAKVGHKVDALKACDSASPFTGTKPSRMNPGRLIGRALWCSAAAI